MAGFLTHYLHGQGVLAQLPHEITSIVKGNRERIFNLGAQGPDIFFYYAPGFLWARTKNIGSEIHRTKFNQFFLQMARLLKNIKNREQQEILFAYLAGLLTHYSMDTHAHPFVNAFTLGAENALNTNGSKTTNLQKTADHRHYETALDVLMLLRLTGQKPAAYRQWELIQAPSKHKQIAAAAFSAAATKIYERDIMPRDVYYAMGHMAQLTRLLHSPKGRRKSFTAFLEDATIKARILSSMVHMQEVNDGRDYLNLSRDFWEGKNASFPEIFDYATEEAAEFINALYRYMHSEMLRNELATKLGNRSLSTGEDLAEV